jgi:hypothetical protein
MGMHTKEYIHQNEQAEYKQEELGENLVRGEACW